MLYFTYIHLLSTRSIILQHGHECPNCDKLHHIPHSPSTAPYLCDGTSNPHKNYFFIPGHNMFAHKQNSVMILRIFYRAEKC